MEFSISNLKPMDRNTLKAFFDLNFGPLLILGCNYHKLDEKAWVNFPNKEYVDKESGEKKCSAIIKIPDESRYWKFQKWCVAEVEILYQQSQAQAPPVEEPENVEDDFPF